MKAITIIENCNCKGCPANRASAECVMCLNDRTKREQVPETYEELRSLCIEISTKEDHIHIFNDWGTNNEFLMTHSLKFYPDGTICVNGDNEFIIAKNKTVVEMWNIIRALLEVKK